MSGPAEFQHRGPTPPCIRPPPRLEDDLFDTMFYYSPDAGAMILPIGKYKREAINMQSESYLSSFKVVFSKHSRACEAIDKYKEGLWKYVKYNYHLFVVPFGEKHRGQPLGEFRDDSWIRWTTGDEPNGRHLMRAKHPLIYEAMSNWMQHGGPLDPNDTSPQAVQKPDTPPLRNVKTVELVRVENGQEHTSQSQRSIKTDSESERPVVVKEEESDSEVMRLIKAEPLTPQRRSRSRSVTLASSAQGSVEPESEEEHYRKPSQEGICTPSKRKKAPSGRSPKAYQSDDEEFKYNATSPGPTVPETPQSVRRSSQESPFKKARLPTADGDSSDEEYLSPPSPTPVRRANKRYGCAA